VREKLRGAQATSIPAGLQRATCGRDYVPAMSLEVSTVTEITPQRGEKSRRDSPET
jgi:hypothetical protein